MSKRRFRLPGGAGSDFIPDLCRPPILFLLVLVTELLALVVVLALSGVAPMDWELLGLVSFQFQCVAVLSAGILCALRDRLGRWPDWLAGAVSYTLVLLVATAVSLFGQWLLLERWQEPQLDWPLLVRDLFIAAIIAGIALRYLYLQQQLRNQQQAELRARVQALQSRIRPHFLFNSLNSLASLIAIDPERAEQLVEDLADLFRASLAEPALVPLERELALCRRYAAIEQLRLGERLQIQWHVEADTQERTIPGLLLQPLLENAVFHGIEPRSEGGGIDVEVSERAGKVHIVIRNPLPPERRTPARGNRMALDNVRHRLAAHYGPAGRLSSREEQGIFVTEISYPVG